MQVISEIDISTSPENYKNEDISIFRKVNFVVKISAREYMYGANGLSRFLNYRYKWTGRQP